MSEVAQSLNLPSHQMLSPAWEALFEAIEDGVCVQLPDTRIVRANRAFAEMIGLAPAQIIGRMSAEVFGWEQGANRAPALTANALTGQAPSEEVDGQWPGQRLRARFSPVRDEWGTITAYVMVVRDITDAIAHEREIARVEQQARFGELAAGLAHEIKNPLAGIQGAVDILLGRRAADDLERPVLEGVRREVGRINSTVQMLLDRARPRALNLRPAAITEAVERAVNLARASLKPEHRERIRLDFDSASSLITMPVDIVQLEDAVLNLLLNAIDAVDGEGEITCGFMKLRPRAKAAGRARSSLRWLIRGAGLARKIYSASSAPFTLLILLVQGLGCPPYGGVARAHGGRVEVSSVVRAGSIFSLCLPRKSV